MSRILQTFERSYSKKRKAFIPFVSAGDPDLATTARLVLKLDECGANIVELGIPFSDPMADGPTIQRSSQRALENGTTISAILDLVRSVREHSEIPIVLFSYFNPLLRFGPERLAREAAAVGVDGILITDIVDDEATEIRRTFREYGLDLISLVATTTSDKRLEKLATEANGFIYVVSQPGVTGARLSSSVSTESLVERLRRHTDLPIAVGFGISTRAQVEDIWRFADGAVVGSAIVSAIECSNTADEAVKNVGDLVDRLLRPVANTSPEI